MSKAQSDLREYFKFEKCFNSESYESCHLGRGGAHPLAALSNGGASDAPLVEGGGLVGLRVHGVVCEQQ